MSSFVSKKVHLQKALFFCFHLKKSVAESHHLLVETYREHALSETTCRNWFRRFKDVNDFDVNDKVHPGQMKKFKDGELETLLKEDSYQMLKK